MSNDELKQLIQDAMAKGENLKATLEHLNTEIAELRMKLAVQEFSVDVGTIVKSTRRRGNTINVGDICKVAMIVPSDYGGRPHVWIRRKKKCGEWSDQVIQLFDDWEPVNP